MKGDENLSYYVRLMDKEDIAQVTEIDRETLPTQWPPNYQHELRNRLARHIVACDEEKPILQPEVKTSSEKDLPGLTSWLRQLLGRNHSSDNALPPPNRHCIIGFAGLWVMADEAHITSIAVREAYRRQGVGELLMISALDIAEKLKARIATLEVRASNATAQSLYVKYGFTQVGVRRGYYVDNREDGILMSTQDISSVAFQRHLEQLKQAHSGKSGITTFQIATNYPAQQGT
ncbi:ribosomal protein S18-alanine N-acetyltransferase [Chloroflexota bacterium]